MRNDVIGERRDYMSQLQGILTRLVNLREQASGSEAPQRFFEVEEKEFAA